MEDIGYLELYSGNRVEKAYLDLSSYEYIQQYLDFYIDSKYEIDLEYRLVCNFLNSLSPYHNRYIEAHVIDKIHIHLSNIKSKVYIVGKNIPMKLVDKKSLGEN